MKKIITNTGTLYASHLPSIEELKSSGIKFDIIWNLTKEFSYFCIEEKNFANNVLCANIEDFSTPKDIFSFKEQLFEVIKVLKKNGIVLVHCLGGKGRTGIAVACIKILLDNLSVNDSLIFAKKYCNGPETEGQIEFIKYLNKILV